MFFSVPEVVFGTSPCDMFVVPGKCRPVGILVLKVDLLALYWMLGPYFPVWKKLIFRNTTLTLILIKVCLALNEVPFLFRLL